MVTPDGPTRIASRGPVRARGWFGIVGRTRSTGTLTGASIEHEKAGAYPIGGDWSGRRGSNSRHAAWKAAALPTELLPRGPQNTATTRPLADEGRLSHSIPRLESDILSNLRSLRRVPQAGRLPIARARPDCGRHDCGAGMQRLADRRSPRFDNHPISRPFLVADAPSTDQRHPIGDRFLPLLHSAG